MVYLKNPYKCFKNGSMSFPSFILREETILGIVIYGTLLNLFFQLLVDFWISICTKLLENCPSILSLCLLMADLCSLMPQVLWFPETILEPLKKTVLKFVAFPNRPFVNFIIICIDDAPVDVKIFTMSEVWVYFILSLFYRWRLFAYFSVIAIESIKF